MAEKQPTEVKSTLKCLEAADELSPLPITRPTEIVVVDESVVACEYRTLYTDERLSLAT